MKVRRKKQTISSKECVFLNNRESPSCEQQSRNKKLIQVQKINYPSFVTTNDKKRSTEICIGIAKVEFKTLSTILRNISI